MNFANLVAIEFEDVMAINKQQTRALISDLSVTRANESFRLWWYILYSSIEILAAVDVVLVDH